MTTRTRQLIVSLIFGTLLLTTAWPAAQAAPGLQDTGTCQTVVSPQRGDGWSSVATRYGVSIAALKAANPQAVRRNDQLWLSDRLCIPGTPAATPTAPATATATATAVASPTSTAAVSATPAATTAATYYTVRAGDGWFAIAQRLGVPFLTLWNANPELQRPGRTLYIGERLLVPGTGATAAATSTIAVAPTVAAPTPTATATTAVRVPPTTATTVVRPPSTIAPTSTATRRVSPTATPSPVVRVTRMPAAGLPACPSDLAGYTAAVEQVLSIDVGKLVRWLQDCSGGKSGARGLDIDGDGQRDVIAIVADASSPAATPPSDLLIFHGTTDPKVWDLRYQAGANGALSLLETGDLNADGKPDIAWTDTTCGAHTCFARVRIISWDAAKDEYVDMIGSNATMATPQVRFADVNSGSGKELILHGGEIGSVGAGPQRAWTEIWASLEGQPYVLVDRTYDPSNCLYHHVLDANDLLSKGEYADAALAYQDIVENTTLEACGDRPNELNELREFAWFRWALALAYDGQPAAAGQTVAALTQSMPGGFYAPVANIWWSAYGTAQDASAACAVVRAYAQSKPDVWKILADFGYANPTFSASDVCIAPPR